MIWHMIWTVWGNTMNHETYNSTVTTVVLARGLQGIKAQEMAKKCGVSRQTIFNFESGKTVSYKLLLQYISILYTPEEAADIIEKWGH